jgi:hypothetical protein
MITKLSGKLKPSNQTDSNLNKKFFVKILFLPLCLIVYTSVVAFGQTINEFKDIWVNESKEYLLNNQKPLPYLQSGFFYFSRQQDDAFTEELEHNWEKFSIVPATYVPKSKKFDPAPQFTFEETSYHNPRFLPCFVAENNQDADNAAPTNLPRIRKPEYTCSNPNKQTFRFYGNILSITWDKLLSLPVNQPIKEGIILDYWKKFIIGNSNHLVGQLAAIRTRLGLNDWGYFLLVKSCANAIYTNDETGIVLLSWALMIRSGFDVKIGYNQLGTSILYNTASKIYGTPSVKINGNTYYIDRQISSFPIISYHSNHPEATGTIQLRLKNSSNFQGETQYKRIQFSWDKKIYEFNLKYNPEEIRFLEEYPQTDPELYFNAPFSFLSSESLFKQFKPVLSGMRKEEAVAFLQQFVQKSFAYRPFNDLYGYDRFMFPEELLFKDESNDKGKSLLYAWMITHLLNQKAALVEFPGFFSVAISMDQPMDGDNFHADGRNYTIADPTFDNAPLGLVMKEFYLQKPTIRLLKTSMEEAGRKEKIWNQALNFGAGRSGAGNDFLMDESGNSYITGFFNDKITNQNAATTSPFVAKFDENCSLVWMVKFRSDGSSFGLELRQLDKNEFYLAGSFRGKLECNGKMVETNPSNPDLFMAQFDRQGDIEWMTKCGLDELEEDAKLFYVIRFTRSGDIQSVKLANEDERSGTTGFMESNNEGLCYIASRYQTTGLDKASEEALPKPINLIRQNMNRMKQLGIEKNTATLAGLFQALIISGNQLSNAELTSLQLEKVTQENSSTPKLIEAIQKIRLIRNKDGIISILMDGSIPVKFSTIKISGTAHIKIIPLDNNDLKISVIDGLEYESGLIREKINSLIIDLMAGYLVIDMGLEHHIISKNLKY